MNEFQTLLLHLKQPEYIHVLINPMPLYGMAAGAFFLVASFLRTPETDKRVALLWIVFVGMMTGLAVWYGQRGYDRVYSMSNEDAQKWLDVHMHRAEALQYLFYLTGLSALLSLMRWKTAAWNRLLPRLTLILAILSVAAAGWISHAGGQVRHSEFRDGPPNDTEIPQEEHHHAN